MESQSRNRFARWFAPETLVQSLGIGLALTIVSRLVGLGRGVMFARSLDRAELGTWAITLNTMQMLSIVLVFGIPAGLCRYVARYQRDGQLGSFLIRSLGVSFGICTAACLAGVVLCRPLARVVYEDSSRWGMAALLSLGALSLIALNLLQGAMQGLRVYKINAVMLVIQSLGFAGLAAAMFVFWQPTALAGTTAFVVMSIVVTAVPAWMLWRHLRAEPFDSVAAAPAGAWKQLLAYSLGTWGSSGLFAIWGVLDRYILLHFDTLGSTACLEQLGTYHIVENVTAPLQALGAGWSVQVLAHTVYLWESDRKREAGEQVQLATKLTTLVLMFVAAGLVVLKRFVLVDIFGDRSLASGEILEYGLAVALVLVGQCMLRSWVLCHERVSVISVAWGVTVAASCALNVVLVPLFHLRGAAITSVVTAAVSSLMLMWFTHRAGLRLDRSTYAASALPLALLLPAPFMLGTLAVAVLAIPRTEWLLSNADKEKINDHLGRLLARRIRKGAQQVGHALPDEILLSQVNA